MKIPVEIENIMKEKNLTHFESFLKKKDKYILDKDKNVIPADLMEWGTFMEETHNERIVKKDDIDGKHISTVFLGLDHNFRLSNEAPYFPYIFETMIFNENDKDIYTERYSTWKEAEKGHERAIQWVKNGCKHDE